MKRKRRHTEAGEYSDPLKDYSPPHYEDDLERALCEDPVTKIQTQPFHTVTPQTTVEQTLQVMAQLDIACVMVVEDGRLVGVFSERDVVNRVAHQYDEIRYRPIRDVMTTQPISVYETDNPAKALNLMAVGEFRHLPIVNLDNQVIGILGPRRVTRYLSQYLKIS